MSRKRYLLKRHVVRHSLLHVFFRLVVYANAHIIEATLFCAFPFYWKPSAIKATMRFTTVCALAILQLTTAGFVNGFSASPLFSSHARLSSETAKPFSSSYSSLAIATASSGDESVELSSAEKKKIERRALVRQEGGIFAFDTKYGALNPFAIYYGLVAVFLGIPWFFALTFCQLFYFVTGNRIDKRVSYSLCAVLLSDSFWDSVSKFFFFLA